MINLIAATQAEANPVIETLRLTKIQAPFSYYRNDEIQLVISGIGKCNAATACGWLAHLDFSSAMSASQRDHQNSSTSVAWLNFGIAGHQTAEPGATFIAHKVTDKATDKTWFPHRIISDIKSSDLITVDKPLSNYLPDQLHDMEASAFLCAARRFSDAELAHSLKVVSDNKDHPLSGVDAKLASKLIAGNLESIKRCINRLQELCNIVEPTNKTVSIAIQQRWRFTASQVVQLDRFIQRYNVLHSPLTDIPEPLLTHTSSKSILNWFMEAVNKADVTL